MTPLRGTKLVVGFLCLSLVEDMAGKAQKKAPIDLQQATLEELIDITVTSVSEESRNSPEPPLPYS